MTCQVLRNRHKKINGLIERGSVLMSDGPVSSKAYWDCWGDGVSSEESSAEYARYIDRCMETMRLCQELEIARSAVSELRTPSAEAIRIAKDWKKVLPTDTGLEHLVLCDEILRLAGEQCERSDRG